MIRVIHLLMRGYPRELRQAHGTEMRAALDEAWRERRGPLARIRLVLDLIRDLAMSWMRAAGARSPAFARTSHRSTVDRGASTSDMSADFRSARRLFTRTPLFALGAVVTLSLGIGAASAIFSLADATLLRPLPINRADRVWQVNFSWSHPDYRDLEKHHDRFSMVTAWSSQRFGLEHDGESIEIDGATVAGSYFPLTGLAPVAGRFLNTADDAPGAPAVAVISARLWKREFNSAANVLGRVVSVNRRPVTIVGVAPANFRGLSLRDAPELFVSIASIRAIGTGFLGRPGIWTNRDTVWLQVAGRLEDGASPAQAEAAMTAAYLAMHPNEKPDPDNVTTLVPVVRYATGLDASNAIQEFVFVLAGATTVTLLLACATVANLLLERSARRRREMAVRVALGASRARIFRLLATESAAIGVAGSVGGLIVARLTFALLGSFELPGRVSIGDLGLRLSPIVLGSSLALGFLTSVIFGVVPALQAVALPAQDALRDARGATRRPMRSALVAAEVALCVMLLAGSLAFGRAMQYALSVNLGFDTAQTSIMSFNASRVRYTRVEIADAERRMLEALRAESWVAGAAWSSMLPLRGAMSWQLGLPHPPSGVKPVVTLEANVVSDGYFETMRIPLRAGRLLTPADNASAPLAIVVSESTAAAYFPNGDAVGSRVSTNPASTDPAVIATIIGVVGDVKHDLNKPRAAMFYAPSAQQTAMLDFGGRHLVIRTSIPPEVGLTRAAAIVHRIEPGLPISRSQTMADHLGSLLMAQRLGLTLFLLFAVLAIVLTTLGIYAVIASGVAHRTREIGVRVALGADRRRVLSLVIRQGLAPVVAGVTVGLIGFGLSTSALEAFLFSIPATTVGTLALLATGIGALAFVATVMPARRALAVDPARALRQD